MGKKKKIGVKGGKTIDYKDKNYSEYLITHIHMHTHTNIYII